MDHGRTKIEAQPAQLQNDGGERPAAPRGHRNVVWFCSGPSPYNNYLFEHLHQRFGDAFQVYFHHARIEHSPWGSLDIDKPWMHVLHPVLGADWNVVRKLAGASDTLIVLAGWNTSTNRLIALANWFGDVRNVVFWTDVPKQDFFRHSVRNILLRPFFRRARAVMGTGVVAVERLKKMGAPAQKIVNFPCWTEIPDHARSEFTLPVRFGCIGRLVEYKGFDNAIRAIARLPQGKAVLDILGTGPDEARLKRLVHELHAEDRVVFHGWCEPAAVNAYLATQCSCLLHPAPELEPYGVVILEAMAHGIPVIASRAAAAAVDRVEHGRGGYILELPISVDVLTAHMEEMTDLEHARSMGREARRVAEEWPIERAVDIIEELARTKE